MVMEGYAAINLKLPMIEAIDKMITTRKELAYKSRDDFVRDAVRNALVKHGVDLSEVAEKKGDAA